MSVIVNVLDNGTQLPEYKTAGAAGMDVCSTIDTLVPSHGTCLVKTGLFVAIPEGYEIQVRPRSGLALKSGITVLNSPGTVDSDFRGEIGVILYNITDKDFIVNKGDRIAQLVLTKYKRLVFNKVTNLDETARGFGGYGSTGK